jgi:hypothetical protein
VKLQRNLHNNNLEVTWQQWSHNLMRVVNKVSDYQLHHKSQWQAAMTTHWLHQFWTVGLDKHISIHPKSWVNCYTCILSFCHISGSNGKTQSWCWLALERHS